MNDIKLKTTISKPANARENAQNINKQHIKGKLTALERINILVDADSFEEYGSMARHRCSNFGMSEKMIQGDGVITGKATINGRVVCLYSQDFTILGGSLGEAHAKKICRIMDMAANIRAPIIGINDSGGARIQEGVDSLAGYGEIFQRNVDLSGVIPQISLIMGPCAGGAVYSPSLTDFIFMVKNSSFMFVTGPNVIKAVTYENITQEKLGGAKIHSQITGIADRVFENDIDLLQQTREFMQFIPENNIICKSKKRYTDDSHNRICNLLKYIIPENSNMPYNMHHIINEIVDEHYFYEIKNNFAANIITGFAYIGGITVGIVANQPLVLAGCLDIKSSRKAARFIRFCDAFSIPIVSLVDVPGFMPGTEQEHNGIICHGSKLAYAYAEASVLKINIIIRKSYGGAYIVMSSKHLGGDLNYSWPNAEIAVMGPKSAVEIIFKQHLDNKEKINTLVNEYTEKFATPEIAASRGYIDKIIKPEETRKVIVNALKIADKKKVQKYWKKHDNMPL